MTKRSNTFYKLSKRSVDSVKRMQSTASCEVLRHSACGLNYIQKLGFSELNSISKLKLLEYWGLKESRLDDKKFNAHCFE